MEYALDSQFKLFALFQNSAGVITANKMPPIVEWSSARREDVWSSPIAPVIQI